MSKKQKILEYLQSGKSITPLEALHKFGSMRLGAVVWDLQKAGYDIRNVQHLERYPEEWNPAMRIRNKEKTVYAEYILIPEVLEFKLF